MDWASIEEVIYSECDRPREILGTHAAGSFTLLQAYFPGASEVVVEWKENGKPTNNKLEIADDDGFFAVLLPTRDPGAYTYAVTYEERTEGSKTLKKRVVKCGDPYRFESQLSANDIAKLNAGTYPAAERKLGAHPMTIDGENGVYFAVWAPGAIRVSVIGSFNDFDGRTCQMNRKGDSGIFELFVPYAEIGDQYQFELKLHGGVIRKVSDPYARGCAGEGMSVVVSDDNYKWTDASFIKNRKSFRKAQNAVSIYEVNPADFIGGGKPAFVNMIDAVIPAAKTMNFTHVELLPVMERGAGDHDDHRTYSFFATDHEFGTPDELKDFVNKLHAEGIGLILDWVPAYFAPDAHGLACLDGTCLYEHQDPRQGVCPDTGALIFNYARPQVHNFLLSAGLYWAREFHADGIRTDGVARMLYLDYARNDGAWVANMYGGNENLDAIDFIREFNGLLNSKCSGVMSIAEDSSAHPQVTDPAGEGGLGFDIKFNYAFTEEYFRFIGRDPLYRGQGLTELNNGMTYAFADKYMLGFHYGHVGKDGKKLLDRFPGTDEQKEANLRLSLAYMFTHPGAKMLAAKERRTGTAKLVADLNRIYRDYPALHTIDNDPACFEWLSSMNYEQCCISYIRKTDDPEEMLVVAVNFSGAPQTFITGAPYEGKYREILNSEDMNYGGKGKLSKTVKRASDLRYDGRTQSLTLKLAPLSVVIYEFIPYTEEELEKVIEERIRSYTPIKRSKPDKKEPAAKSVHSTNTSSKTSKTGTNVSKGVKKPVC